MDATRLPLGAAALFLDLDGTLVAIAPTPEAAKADPACVDLLQRLGQHLCGRLAILSGRNIGAVDDIIGRCVVGVAGVHGLERRTAMGDVETCASHPAVARSADVMEALARASCGLQVERKGSSVAVHYRQAPAAEEAVLDTARRLADASGLEVLRGKAVVELKTPGASKAFALRSFMLEPPFAGCTPLVLGDDVTDESAFEAAAELGGFGVLVGEPRDSHARHRLANPPAVHAWLAQALDTEAFDLEGASWLG